MRLADAVPEDGWDVVRIFDPVDGYRVRHTDFPPGATIEVERWKVEAKCGFRFRRDRTPSELDQKSAAVACVREYLMRVASGRLVADE